jgi:hypothetical protein
MNLIWNENVLIITGNNIGNLGARLLSDYFKSNSSLQDLNLSGKLHPLIWSDYVLIISDNNIRYEGARSLKMSEINFFSKVESYQ